MTRQTAFSEGWSWFKFNSLGLALGRNLKSYTSVAKGIKLKVKGEFLALILTFVEVTEEKPVGGWGAFCPASSWIGWRLNSFCDFVSDVETIWFTFTNQLKFSHSFHTTSNDTGKMKRETMTVNKLNRFMFI